MPAVEDRVIRVVRKVVENPDTREIHIDSTFAELGFDSLAAIELVFEIEEEFGITITGDGIRSIAGVREVVAGVERILAGEDADFGGSNGAS